MSELEQITKFFDLSGSEELSILVAHVEKFPEQRHLLEQFLAHIEFRENAIIAGVFFCVGLAIALRYWVKWQKARFSAKLEKLKEDKKL